MKDTREMGQGGARLLCLFTSLNFLAPVSPGEMGMDFSCKGLRDGKACTAELRKPRLRSQAGNGRGAQRSS